jgi:hypothetical protein
VNSESETIKSINHDGMQCQQAFHQTINQELIILKADSDNTFRGANRSSLIGNDAIPRRGAGHVGTLRNIDRSGGRVGSTSKRLVERFNMAVRSDRCVKDGVPASNATIPTGLGWGRLPWRRGLSIVGTLISLIATLTTGTAPRVSGAVIRCDRLSLTWVRFTDGVGTVTLGSDPTNTNVGCNASIEFKPDAR